MPIPQARLREIVQIASAPKTRYKMRDMFEHHQEPLLRKPAYHRRLLRHLGMAGLVVIASLSVGILGYHCCEGLGWLDSFVNASMILSGMGPVNELHHTAGKVFAGCYALFSGVAFILIAGILFAPVVHRFLHKFHLDMSQK
jgi:hypothetical protein